MGTDIGREARLEELVIEFRQTAELATSETPLHTAARNGDVDKIRRLICQGYYVDTLDAHGNTPLLDAFSNCSSNRLEVVQTLVNFGAFGNRMTRDGCLTALQLCCTKKPPDFLQVTDYLLTIGTNIYVRTNLKRNVIHLASYHFTAKELHEYIMLIIRKNFQELLLERDYAGTTPLHMATRLELSEATLQALRDHGADFNSRNVEGVSVFDMAVRNKRSKEFLQILRRFGAMSRVNIPPEAPGPHGWLKPLDVEWKLKLLGVMERIGDNPSSTVQEINELNSEWTSRNKRGGNSLLHAAARYRIPKMVELLLTMGFDTNAVGKTGFTPLQLCLENNLDDALEITNMLLAHGAQVEFIETHKYSCFHVCSSRRPPDWIPVFHRLLQHTKRSEDIDKALYIAKENLTLVEYIELEDYLRMKREEETDSDPPKQESDDQMLELVLQMQETTTSQSLYRTASIDSGVESGEGSSRDSPEDEFNEHVFHCVQCREEFESSFELQVHRRKKHGREKMRQCPECHKIIKTPQGFEIHMRTHTLEKPYMCDICGNRYQAHSGLRKHLISHSGKRPHVCTICMKTFALKSILKDHIKTHSEQGTPFACISCGKRFRFKKGLTRHERTHTNAPKFSCHVCKLEFDRKDNLKRHIKRLHSSPATATESN